MAETILLVDDEEDILDILYDFLSHKGYKIICARNGKEALSILADEPCSCIVSDINMPGMKGFELLEIVSQQYPSVKRALITAYDVRDYLQLAKNHNIGNIIAKTTPFNFDEIDVMIRNIMTEEVFGLDRYIKGDVQSLILQSTADIEPVMETVCRDMSDSKQKRKFRQALGEIIVNAIYYGAKNERGDEKNTWDLDVTLTPDEQVTVAWGCDAEKNGVAVSDRKGRLKKGDVLYWLERNTRKTPDGISVGLFDEHGKGLYITRETIDRLIINIKRNVCTEVIMINYHDGLYEGYRPLWIHEF